MRPLLAATLEDIDALDFAKGWSVSAKLDGIRCLIIDGVAMSRSLKPIRNKHVQFLFGRAEFEGYDGELIVDDPCSKTCYRDTNSGVMSQDGEPDVRFHVFDNFARAGQFIDRYASLHALAERMIRVQHHYIATKQQLLDLEEHYLNRGYEGLMLRRLDGPYKHGRSTLKEGILMKLKRFADDEFQVIGFEERMENLNEAKVNALGRMERSSHKDNKRGRGDLGALVLRTPEGVEFTCGTGFTDEDRAHIWDNRNLYMGAWAKVKHFPIGVKDAPRFPVWLGFRDREDM